VTIRAFAVWCAVAVGAVIGLVLTACSASELVHAGSCAKPPARPIGITRTERALQRQGINVIPDASCEGATHIVTILTAETSESSVFCNVEKSPAPRFRDRPGTIFEGKGTLGKGYDLALANVVCFVYGDRNLIARVRRALVELGGQRTEPF
jgi:hypothetical protein